MWVSWRKCKEKETKWERRKCALRVHVEYTGINVDEGNITMLVSLFFYFIYFFNLAKFNVKIGSSNKRTRGPTRCLQIHVRNTEDCPTVILDKDRESVGPNIRVISNLSYFLGTLARNSDFCPQIYTNFKALLKGYKEWIWKYVMVMK